MVQELGGVVERVVVNNLSNATFFAQLYVRVADKELEIDARPSDALALAVRIRETYGTVEEDQLQAKDEQP